MADEIDVDAGTVYEITIRGIIDREWSDWFDTTRITHPGEHRTRLVGLVVDQAALYGLLYKIYSLGLVLVSVQRMED